MCKSAHRWPPDGRRGGIGGAPSEPWALGGAVRGHCSYRTLIEDRVCQNGLRHRWSVWPPARPQRMAVGWRAWRTRWTERAAVSTVGETADTGGFNVETQDEAAGRGVECSRARRRDGRLWALGGPGTRIGAPAEVSALSRGPCASAAVSANRSCAMPAHRTLLSDSIHPHRAPRPIARAAYKSQPCRTTATITTTTRPTTPPRPCLPNRLRPNSSPRSTASTRSSPRHRPTRMATRSTSGSTSSSVSRSSASL